MDSQIRTSHIGSLPRPPELLKHLEESETGDLPGELSEDATRDVVQKQLDIGLDVVNNGEQSRTGFHIHVLDRLSGFTGEGVAPFWADVRDYPGLAETEFDYPDADPETKAPRRPAVTEPVEYHGAEAAREELDTLFDCVDAADSDPDGTFMTAPSPGIVATSLPNQYYDTHEEYLFAVADAMATEYEIIGESDALLQVDAPDLLHTHHREFHDGRDFTDRSIDEYLDVVERHVKAVNHALGNVSDSAVRLHTCWGNYEGPHHRDVPLVEVLPKLYELDVDHLAVEQSGSRHAHEYRAFAEHHPPDGMTLVPGVVDVKTNVVDHPETVADRLERVADAVGDPSRLVAAPDCGFGTLAWSSAVEGIAWAKLESLVEGAQIASDRLF